MVEKPKGEKMARQKRDLKELRELVKIDRPKAMYIFSLQYKKALKRYITKEGYVAYDANELSKIQRNTHRGRPRKEI